MLFSSHDYNTGAEMNVPSTLVTEMGCLHSLVSDISSPGAERVATILKSVHRRLELRTLLGSIPAPRIARFSGDDVDHQLLKEIEGARGTTSRAAAAAAPSDVEGAAGDADARNVATSSHGVGGGPRGNYTQAAQLEALQSCIAMM